MATITVVFHYKDYARGGASRTLALKPTEFIRRFLQHVLPRRFVRIRYFGLLANRTRKVNLERARALLNAPVPELATTQHETWQEFLHRLTGDDPALCPRCGKGTLRRHRELPKDDFVRQRGPPQ